MGKTSAICVQACCSHSTLLPGSIRRIDRSGSIEISFNPIEDIKKAPYLRFKRGIKGQPKREAKARIIQLHFFEPDSWGTSTIRSGTSQPNRCQKIRAIEAVAISTSSSPILLRKIEAGGDHSKSLARGKQKSGAVRHFWHNSRSSGSKQWQHLPTGSGGANRSQQAAQKNRLSYGCAQERHKGG